MKSASPKGFRKLNVPRSTSDRFVAASISLFCVSLPGLLFAADPPPWPGSWTLLHLPDTQNYVTTADRAEILNRQMTWVRDNRSTRDIRFAVQVGDLVNDNTEAQWMRSRAGFDILGNDLPCAFSSGNHDCGPSGSGDSRATSFSLAPFYGPGSPYASQPTVVGFFQHPDDPPGNTQNAWHTFKAGPQHYLVLTCEWGPRDKVVEWMDGVVSAHPFHRAILVCHAYLASGSARFDWAQSQSAMNPHSFGIAADPDGTNDGEELWNKLVRKHENFCLVSCGHAGRGFRTVTGLKGNNVHEMLFNTQDLANGGDGWIRLLEFLPDGRTVQARTYSTNLDEWDEDAAATFQFSLSEVSKTDTDADGMPDYHEVQHGWPTNSPSNAEEDADSDGAANLEEFMARTSPLDPASRFTISSVTTSPAGQLTIEWESIPGVSYVLQASSSLAPTAAWEDLGTPLLADSFSSRTTVTREGSRKFFKVTVMSPE